MAAASQSKSPRMSPAINGTTPVRPLPMTRATNATTPGPGETAPTSSAPVKIKRPVISMKASRTKYGMSCQADGGDRSYLDHPQSQRGALAVMGMGDRDRERVGGIRGFRVGLGQQ